MQVITHLDQANSEDGLDDKLSGKMVQGENIAQTWQFVVSGNAQLGFIARSQLIFSGRENSGSQWDIPTTLYQPVEQMGVALKPSGSETSTQKTISATQNAKDIATAEFMQFLRSDKAKAVIRRYGYNTDDHADKSLTQKASPE